jgi:hypothetical protein
MDLLIITLFLFEFGFLVYWLTSGPVYAERKKESPILDRKARFALYVQGERQLMADWEAAFNPQRAALAEKQKGYKVGGVAWLATQLQANDGNPYLSFNDYMTPVLDRDQCKLEADHMLSHALITEREYGPRIARCNQEMQA